MSQATAAGPIPTPARDQVQQPAPGPWAWLRATPHTLPPPMNTAKSNTAGYR